MHHEKILFYRFDLDEIIFNSEIDTREVINPQRMLFVFNCLNCKKMGCKTILVDKYREIIRTNKKTKKLMSNINGSIFMENKRNMSVIFKEFLGFPLKMNFLVDKVVVIKQMRIAENIMLKQSKVIDELNVAFQDIIQMIVS